ncbi:hypothetical protein CE91St28_14400 [Pyramidobacter piscolens]|nr:hypothetical protein CE91St28_14400 [Pyramidobacter piscolens]
MEFANAIRRVNRLDYAPGGRSRSRQYARNRAIAQQMSRRVYRARRRAEGKSGG